MDIVYTDDTVLVCVKPAGVLSTDEPGGLPSLVREALGDRAADVRTVHRLDRAVSGLIVLALFRSDVYVRNRNQPERLAAREIQKLT